MLIEINEEDIFNLKISLKRLIKISEPYVDLDPITIKSIIDRYEKGKK